MARRARSRCRRAAPPAAAGRSASPSRHTGPPRQLRAVGCDRRVAADPPGDQRSAVPRCFLFRHVLPPRRPGDGRTPSRRPSPAVNAHAARPASCGGCLLRPHGGLLCILVHEAARLQKAVLQRRGPHDPRRVGALFVFLALMRVRTLERVLSWRPAVALGRISYGIYLLHLPATYMRSRSASQTHGSEPVSWPSPASARR